MKNPPPARPGGGGDLQQIGVSAWRPDKPDIIRDLKNVNATKREQNHKIQPIIARALAYGRRFLRFHARKDPAAMILETVATLPIGDKPMEAETTIDTQDIVVLFKQSGGRAGVVMVNGLVMALHHSYADLVAIMQEENAIEEEDE